MDLRVKGQSFDQPDSIRMLRRELHISSIILAFLLFDGLLALLYHFYQSLHLTMRVGCLPTR